MGIDRMIADRFILNEGEVPFQRPRIDVAAELQLRIGQLRRDFYDPTAGRVDYPALKNSAGFADYCEVCRLLQEYDLLHLESRQAKTAFWINLYNSLILHGVIAFKIQKTVKEVYDFFGRVRYRIGITDYSANDIEHGILRANSRPPYSLFHPFAEDDLRISYLVEKIDPRIHFALVCGSSSCPPINYYEAGKLDDQLDMAAENFINGDEVEIRPEANLLQLSPLFKWYRADFGGHEGVIDYLVRYSGNPHHKTFLRERGDGARVQWKDYDWALNS